MMNDDDDKQNSNTHTRERGGSAVLALNKLQLSSEPNHNPVAMVTLCPTS
jgi:hypothetical protein